MGERTTESKINRTIQTMKQLSDSDIKEFLENAPLYVWKEFSRLSVNRRSLWIREIDAFRSLVRWVWQGTELERTSNVRTFDRYLEAKSAGESKAMLCVPKLRPSGQVKA